jgi:addiction module RelB/DinJ family antitoxin
MATTVMSIKTDKKIKEKAMKIAKSMGFSLSSLVNAYLRQFVKTKTVHFEEEPSYVMSAYLEKQLEEIEDDIKHDRNISPAFDNVEDALAYLKRDNDDD